MDRFFIILAHFFHTSHNTANIALLDISLPVSDIIPPSHSIAQGKCRRCIHLCHKESDYLLLRFTTARSFPLSSHIGCYWRYVLRTATTPCIRKYNGALSPAAFLVKAVASWVSPELRWCRSQTLDRRKVQGRPIPVVNNRRVYVCRKARDVYAPFFSLLLIVDLNFQGFLHTFCLSTGVTMTMFWIGLGYINEFVFQQYLIFPDLHFSRCRAWSSFFEISIVSRLSL